MAEQASDFERGAAFERGVLRRVLHDRPGLLTDEEWCKLAKYLSDERKRGTTVLKPLPPGDPQPRYIGTGHGASDEAHRAAHLLEKLEWRQSGHDAHVIRVAVSYLRQHANLLAGAEVSHG